MKKRPAMKVINILAKSHYDFGLQYGKQTAPEINKTIDLVKKYSVDKLGSFSKLTNVLLSLSFIVKKRFGKDILETTRGISDGSGIDIKWIYFLNFSYEFGAIFNRMFKFLGCSSFAISQKDGRHVIVGTTTDIIQVDYFTKELIKLRVVLSYKIGNSNLVEMVTFPGQVASDFSIINKSIFIGFNDGGLNTNKNGFLKSLITPVILSLVENSKSFGEIVNRLQREQTIHPYAVIVSDGTLKNTVTMDLTPTGTRMGALGGVVRTNFLLLESDRKKFYESGWQEDKEYISAIKRDEVLRKMVKKWNTLDDAKKMLSAREKSSDYFKGSISNRATANAVIWDGKTRKWFVPETGKFPLLDTSKWLEFEN